MIGMLILRIQLFVLLSGHIGSQHLNEYLDEEQCRCGQMSTKISYRIFNGTPVDPNDLGFVANVFFNTQIINRKLPETNHLLLFNSLCTAVILNSKWFLSARSGRWLALRLVTNFEPQVSGDGSKLRSKAFEMWTYYSSSLVRH